MWPLMPTILSSSSLRNPFITDSTTISVATPSMMPRNEKPAMTETKPSRRRVRRYRPASIHSKSENGFVPDGGVVVGGVLVAIVPLSGCGQAGNHIGQGQDFPLAGGAVLQLHIPLGQALGSDENLPRNADQVRGRE